MQQRQLSFTEAISICFGKYADFSGRASRSEYWWWYLFTAIVSMVFSFLTPILHTQIPYIIAMLILLMPGIAVAVRRLHDINKSGWNLLLALIPLVGAIILLLWYVRESDPNPNQYGVPPYTC
jgi:uncharacterized membrane protein YhaH (DUF805 family)